MSRINYIFCGSLLLVAGTFACENSDNLDERLGSVQQRILAADLARVLSFEGQINGTGADWSSANGTSPANVSFSTAQASSGTHSLAVSGTYYTAVVSIPLTALGQVSSNLGLDVRLPTSIKASDNWKGQVQVTLASSSNNFNYTSTAATFTNATPGQFSPIQIALSSAAVSFLSSGTYSDLTITLVFNLANTDTVYFDNLSFGQSGTGTTGWKRANASQSGQVVAVSRGDTNEEYFWADPVGAFNHSHWNGGSWTSEMMAPAGSVTIASNVGIQLFMASVSKITAVTRDANSWDAFYDSHGQLMHVSWDSASGTHAPSQVPTTTNILPGSYMSAVSRYANQVEVFYVGTDHSLQHVYSEDAGNTWYTPSGLTSSNALRGVGVAAISCTADNMDVYYTTSTFGLGHQNWTGATGWQIVSNPVTSNVDGNSGLAVVSRDGQSLQTFYIDGSEGLSTYGSDYSGALTASNAAIFGTNVAVVSRASNTMEVMFLGAGWEVQDESWSVGPGWQGPVDLLGNVPHPTSMGAIAALSRSASTMTVPYMEANSYRLSEFWYSDSSGWNLSTLSNGTMESAIPSTTDANWPAADPNVPSANEYEKNGVTDIPADHHASDWTNDLQGVANNGTVWYITHGNPTTNQLCKLPLNEPITNFGDWLSNYCLTFPDEYHLGDLDVHVGTLFVPIARVAPSPRVRVYKDNHPYDYNQVSYQMEGDFLTPDSDMSWLAIDHRSGILYGPQADGDELTYVKSFYITYTPGGIVSNITYRTGKDIHLSQTIPYTTGAVFSPNGHMYVASSANPGSGLYSVDITNGNVRYVVPHGSYFPQQWGYCCYSVLGVCMYHCNDEAEGIDYIDLSPWTSVNGGMAGQLHVQMLNNGASDLGGSDDGFSFYHYKVTNPHI